MNKHDGSTLDSLFEELGELEEINARAAKKILAIETERRMKKLGLSTTDLAQRMGTSRNQIHRILDGADAGIAHQDALPVGGDRSTPHIAYALRGAGSAHRRFGTPRPS